MDNDLESQELRDLSRHQGDGAAVRKRGSSESLPGLGQSRRRVRLRGAQPRDQ